MPPIAKKKAVGNKDSSILQERCFILNIFMKQLTRCPYLIEATEFKLFVNQNSTNLTEQLKAMSANK